ITPEPEQPTEEGKIDFPDTVNIITGINNWVNKAKESTPESVTPDTGGNVTPEKTVDETK
ncbi:hypothetical protein SAMN05421767_1045, partial [Granulicatella balaenopterae]